VLKRKETQMSKSAIAAASLFALLAITTAQAQMVEGTVTKLDDSAGKITLKHGPIKKFDMDEGMTMVFRAQDPAMLSQVKVGDKVRFEADKIDGQITVTKIQKAK
jgi:Cu(I)/Ag(I) efflux system protein CusF